MLLNAAHNAEYVGSKSYFAEQETIGALATGEWLLVRPNEEELDPLYIHHWLTSPLARFRIKQLVKGIHLYPKDIARLTIPLPPLEEQKRIAGILDAADQLRTKRQQSIKKLETLKAAVFVDLFGNPSDRDIQTVGLGDIAELINGDRGKNYPSRDALVASGVPFVNAGHLDGGLLDLSDTTYITDEHFSQLRSGKFRQGDVLFCIRGSLGKIALAGPGAHGAIASSLVIVRPKKEISPEFLFGALSGPWIERQIREWDNGTAQPNLAAASLAKFRIPDVAPDAQRTFSDISARQRDLVHLGSINQVNVLITSLQQRAFRGDL